jgi:EAL domain-containing protein (putative c-di-GMP-specific phosphodiesterase class I)
LGAAELLALLTRDCTECIGLLDRAGRFQLLGGAVEPLLGEDVQRWTGRSLPQAADEEGRQQLEQALQEVRHSPETRRTVDYRLHRADGEVVALRSVLTYQARLDGVVVTTRPVSAMSGPRTNPPERADGRSEFLEAVYAAIASQHAPAYTVVALKVLNFHHVAAGLGQDHAKRLLFAVGERLGAVLRPHDSLAQVAPGEIAILLHGIQDEHAVHRFVSRLKARLREPFAIAGEEVIPTVAIGFATSERYYGQADAVLADAEAAAQSTERGRPQGFRSTMRVDYRRSITLAAGLPRAFQRSELEARFQPIVRLQDGGYVGLEALCRWRHPEIGTIPPGEFIPLAEQLDWVISLDRWMIAEACNHLRDWPEATWLSVNVSGRHVDDPELVEAVRQALRSSGLRPERLQLEITETALADNVSGSQRVMEQLKELGIELAIDDFGAGYATFGQLSHIPVGILKIDGSFVSKLDDEHGRNVVQGIIAMGHQLGLQLVAEHVETAEQARLLDQLGCDLAQGYYFAKPMRGPDVQELLQAPSPRRGK